jgi:hypothetical protein
VSVAAPARAPSRPAPKRPATKAAPKTGPRARTRARERAREAPGRKLLTGGVLWVLLLATLFGGIVALNVAALQSNLEGNRLSGQAAQLRTQNARLQADVAAATGWGRWAVLATRLGMAPSFPSRADYIPIDPTRPRATHPRAAAKVKHAAAPKLPLAPVGR